jgi:hypothetical protein
LLHGVTLPETFTKGVLVKSARLVGAAVVVAVFVGGAGVTPALAKVRTHGGPIGGRLRTAAGAVTSTNWSGYAAYGVTFSDEQGRAVGVLGRT